MKKILISTLMVVTGLMGVNVYAQNQKPFTDAQMSQIKICVGMSKVGAVLYQGRFIEGRSKSDVVNQIKGLDGNSKKDLLIKSMMYKIADDVYQVPVPTSAYQMKAENQSIQERALGRCMDYFKKNPIK